MGSRILQVKRGYHDITFLNEGKQTVICTNSHTKPLSKIMHKYVFDKKLKRRTNECYSSCPVFVVEKSHSK